MTIPYHIVVGEKCNVSAIEMLIQTTFSEIDASVNNWNTHSEISRVNALSANERLVISSELADFLQRVGKVVEQTSGLFDPTIAPAVRLWRERLVQGTIPTQEELEALLPCIGWDKLHIEGESIWKEALVELDLGGIAKGYAVDRLAENLRKGGYKHFLICWGGEVYAAGHHPSLRPWQVAKPEGIIPLQDEALATSGDREQYWEVAEGTYTHICHPKTLQAARVEGIGKSASCTAPTCFEADGLATAAYLKG